MIKKRPLLPPKKREREELERAERVVPRATDVPPPPVLSATSLAGFWERGRRLLRLFGQGWDPRVQPVMLVADSREPAGLSDSYRGFSVCIANGGNAIGTSLKLRCGLINGMVIESFSFAHATITTSPGIVLRLMDPALVLSDGAVYIPANAISTASATWTDQPSPGRPPISWSAGGLASAGHEFCGAPINSTNNVPGSWRIFLPEGAALNLHFVAATTNQQLNFACYAR